MSIDMMSRVKKLYGLPMAPRMVLFMLADYANKDGIAFPAIETVAKEIGMHERTARRHFDDFVAASVITVLKPGRRRRAGQQGKGRTIRIDIERAEEMFGIDEDDPEAGCESPDTAPADSEETTGHSERITGRSVQNERAQCPGNHHEPSIRTLARAREGADAFDTGVPDTPGEPGEGRADGDDEDASRELVCAHWRSKRTEIERALGRDFYASWLSRLIPESDDGEKLVLAAPSQFVVDQLRTRFRVHVRKAQSILQRELEIEFRAFARAASRRQADAR